LAHELAQIERDLVTRHAGAVEQARQLIRRAVLERYFRDDPREPTPRRRPGTSRSGPGATDES
jgi:hypothetical protein